MLSWVFFNDIDCAESDEQWIFPLLVLVFYIQSNNKEQSVFFSFMYIEIQNKKHNNWATKLFYSSKGKLECKNECCTIDQLESVLQDTPGCIWDMHGKDTIAGVLPEKINLSH